MVAARAGVLKVSDVGMGGGRWGGMVVVVLMMGGDLIIPFGAHTAIGLVGIMMAVTMKWWRDMVWCGGHVARAHLRLHTGLYGLCRGGTA